MPICLMSVIVNIGKLLWSNYGLAIIVITILIKLVLFPVTMKSLKQAENMKKAQPKLNKIEKKYANKTDQDSMMMKSNEMMGQFTKKNVIMLCLKQDLAEDLMLPTS